jgi:hypothetical protein
VGGGGVISVWSPFEIQDFYRHNNTDKTISSELLQNLKIYDIQPCDFFSHSITAPAVE